MIAAIEIGTVADHLSYYAALNATRRDVVLKALSRARGNRAAAAKELGLNAKYLLQLIKTLELSEACRSAILSFQFEWTPIRN